MQKQEFGPSAREHFRLGINLLVDPVQSTLGPCGRTVALFRGGKPVLTKDGATVASFINSDNPFENIAINIVRQACLETNTEVGDGTTTAAILAKSLFDVGDRLLKAGLNVSEVKKHFHEASLLLIDNLKKLSRPISSIEDVRYVASISANDDEIGAIVANAIEQAGMDGAVIIKETRSQNTFLDVVNGLSIDSGWANSSFVNDERRGLVCYDDPVFLICNHKINRVAQIQSICEQCANANKPLIFVADDVSGPALGFLTINFIRGGGKFSILRAPKEGEERLETLKDMAIALGAKFYDVTKAMNLETFKFSDLGGASSIESNKFRTIIAGGKGKQTEISERIEMLRNQISQCSETYERDRLTERMIRLGSCVVSINVGGLTEVETVERKHRIEDALSAVKSAQSEGILAGGGSSLLRAYQMLDESKIEPDVYEAFEEVVEAPLEQLCRNGDIDEEDRNNIVSEIGNSENGIGYDFRERRICDLFRAGVLDSCAVTISALQNAVSAISTLFTTSYAVADV